MADKTDQRPASPENPRVLERTSDGARARVTDPGEYVTMTTAQGYRDVTEGKTKTKSGSSNVGSGGSGGGSGSGGSESQAGSGGTA